MTLHHLRILSALALLVAAPITSRADEPPTSRAALEARARQFWAARVNEDFAAVWDLLSPLEQGQVARDDYAKHQKERGFAFPSAEVLDVVAEEEVGWVLVKYTIRPRQFDMPPRQVTTWDLWENQEDGWRWCARAHVLNWPRKPPKARPADEEAVLAKRVRGFWDALKAGDYRALWEWLDPDYRSVVPLDEFIRRRAQQVYLSYEVTWVEVVDATSARAKILYEYKYNDPSLSKMQPELDATLEDWIKVDGQWYRRMPAADTRAAPSLGPTDATAAPVKPNTPGRN